jgi:hypothetical protein
MSPFTPWKYESSQVNRFKKGQAQGQREPSKVIVPLRFYIALAHCEELQTSGLAAHRGIYRRLCTGRPEVRICHSVTSVTQIGVHILTLWSTWDPALVAALTCTVQVQLLNTITRFSKGGTELFKDLIQYAHISYIHNTYMYTNVRTYIHICTYI